MVQVKIIRTKAVHLERDINAFLKQLSTIMKDGIVEQLEIPSGRLIDIKLFNIDDERATCVILYDKN